MSLRITAISIQDTYGTRAANFAPGTVTRIVGANGSGKSSILRALTYIFAGGTDPSVIRKGAEQSVIEMTLSDGTKISKTTRPKRSRKGELTGYTTDLEVTQPDGLPKEAPKTYVDELSELLAVDPSTLLRIDTTTVPGKRQLAATLMTLVPISFDPEEVNRAATIWDSEEAKRFAIAQNDQSRGPGIHVAEPLDQLGDVICFPESPEKPLSLDDLKKVQAQITEQRRRQGIARDDAGGAINRLSKALPEGNGDADYAGCLTEAEDFRRAVEEAISRRRLEIETLSSQARSEAKQSRLRSDGETDREIGDKIRALEAERSQRKLTARQVEADALAAIQRAQSDEEKALEAESRPELDKAIAAVQEWKAKSDAHQRAATLRQEIAVQEKTLRECAWRYSQLSGVLDRLEALRLEKLNHLPVAGLEVFPEGAMLDGVEWANVNLARRVEAVLQICTQRSGKLPLLIIDDCEHLDAETRAAIEQGLADAGFQVLEAVVSDGPLSVEVQP